MEYYWPDRPGQNRLANKTMHKRRQRHASVLMTDGRILTVGGCYKQTSYHCSPLISTELFDPQSGTVQDGPNMTVTRKGPGVAVLGDSIYVCGGVSSGGSVQKSCEQFHEGRFSHAPPMIDSRSDFPMVKTNGKLFAIGGRYGQYEGGVQQAVEQFDANKSKWESVSWMEISRADHGAAVLNGLIYVCGGRGPGYPVVSPYYSYHRECERYDPRTDQWETIAEMNKRRQGFSLLAMNGRLYAVGGYSFRPWELSEVARTVESYNTSKNEWTLLSNKLKEARKFASMVVL